MQTYLVYDEARGQRFIDAARSHLISTEAECAEVLRKAAQFGDFESAHAICEKALDARRLVEMTESALAELGQ